MEAWPNGKATVSKTARRAMRPWGFDSSRFLFPLDPGGIMTWTDYALAYFIPLCLVAVMAFGMVMACYCAVADWREHRRYQR